MTQIVNKMYIIITLYFHGDTKNEKDRLLDREREKSQINIFVGEFGWS